MKRKLNVIIVALSVVALLGYVILVDGIDNIWDVWNSSKKIWLFCGVLAMVVYWLLESGIFHVIIKSYYKPQKFKQTLRLSMIGQLFNAITPFATGGQPFQAYEMTKSGIPFGIVTCSLLIKFIFYQTAITLSSAIVLIIKFNEFTSISGFVYLVFVGFLLNLGVLVFLFCIGFFKGFTLKMVNGFIKFCGKLHIFKNIDQKLERAAVEIDHFYVSFQDLKRNKKLFLFNTLASILQIAVYGSVSFFIYYAFGNSVESLFTIVSAQIFVELITAFVPFPGSIGGAEVGFFMFFQIFFPANQLNMAILLWRLFTFYFPIISGGLFYLRKRKTSPTKDEGQVSV